jgi:Arc/MetJ-type ribon-helix-helix transcriptional regulator
MGLTAAAALAVNVFCASRLAPFKRGDASMRSIWLSTRNDAILNTATIAAAGLVALTATAWPDIAAGLLIAGLNLWAAAEVLAQGWRERRVERVGKLPDPVFADALACMFAGRAWRTVSGRRPGMALPKAFTVELSPESAAYVERMVADGQRASVSEAIDYALARLARQGSDLDEDGPEWLAFIAECEATLDALDAGTMRTYRSRRRTPTSNSAGGRVVLPRVRTRRSS